MKQNILNKMYLNINFQSSWFRNSRFKSGKGKSVNAGGAGLGYKESSSSKNHSVSKIQLFIKLNNKLILMW